MMQQEHTIEVPIQVAEDSYTWHVLYQGDEQLSEYDELCPEGRGFAEVDLPRVEHLLLLGVKTALSVRIPQGATPVFFRRRRVEINVETAASTTTTIHCIGWHTSESFENGAYLFVFDDGSAFLTSDRQAL